MSNQYPQNPNWQPAPGAPQRAKQKPFGWLALSIATASALVVGSCGGNLVGSAGKATTGEPGSVVTVTAPGKDVTVTAKPAEPKETKKAEEPEPKAEEPEPKAEETEEPKEEVADEIGDGIWAVGDEVKPGRYKTTVPGGLFVLCSYQRLRDDSGDDDAVITYELANEGERISITLKKGEFFSTDGCGTWKRAK